MQTHRCCQIDSHGYLLESFTSIVKYGITRTGGIFYAHRKVGFLYWGKDMTRLQSFGLRLRWVLDWRFLPDRLQKWLFDTGTRGIEIFNATFMLAFAVVFLFEGSGVYLTPAYYKFQLIDTLIWAVVFVSLGSLQLIALCYTSCRSNIISGYLLTVSSLLWAIVTVSFWASSPPLNTGMFISPVLATICLLAGRNMITHTKCKIKLMEKVRGD